MHRKQPVSSSAKPLPKDFAEQVLRLEISVDVDSSMEALKSLLELYSQAIEYYESIRDQKYKYYQDRMMELFHKQNNLLLAESPPPHTARSNSHMTSDLLQKREVDKTIKQFEVATHEVSRQVSMNLQNQNSTMLSRMNTRKNRNTSVDPRKSSVFHKLPFVTHHKRRSSEGESDKSGGVSTTREAEQFEKELEEIMEESVMEKISKRQEIKKKYREQIEEIQSMGGGTVMQQLAEEMQKRMDEELNALDGMLEDKRKVAIKRIKEFLVKKN
ncbi:hypothetical protein SteCoe_24116 [Stentor coeruleus]|uniref:Uncharacterized protein n=1 Tax=Stentor coeruleus TaxID=5963 RepID=A0A1R2BIE4_9CILI|nr:hypothetical protein SteCoe_24116 [Stentor coeruleus]